MANNQDIVNCIECKKKSRCFQNLVSDELEFVNKHKVQIEYLRGETICKYGSFASTVFYIVDGIVKVYLEGADHKTLTVIILRSGEFLGLASLYEGDTYFYTATALKDTVICSIEKESMRKLIRLNGEFASNIMSWYCMNFGHLFDKLRSFGFKHVNGRVADVLLYLDRPEFREHKLYSYLNRKDIAEIAGIPAESLIRVLSDFSSDGIVKTGTNSIKILKPEMLSRISRGG